MLVCVEVSCSKLQATRTDLVSELETSKGGSDIIDCLCRAHTDALSLELLGISRQRTDLESRSHGLSEGTAGGRRRRRRVA